MDRVHYYVVPINDTFSSHALGYSHRVVPLDSATRYAEMQAGIFHRVNRLSGPYGAVIPVGSDIRLATREDFEKFRVALTVNAELQFLEMSHD